MTEEKKTAYPINIAVTMSFDKEGNGTTWQTTVPQTASLAEINSIMDTVHSAMTRQKQWMRYNELDMHRDMLVRQMDQLVFGIESLEKKYSDGANWTKDDKTSLASQQANLLRHQTTIKMLEEDLKVRLAELKTTG